MRCPSDFDLDLVHLHAGAAPEIKRHAAGCAACQRSLTERRHIADEFRVNLAPRTEGAVLRGAYRRSWSLRRLAPLFALSAVGLTLALLVPRRFAPSYEGLKGNAPTVEVFCRRSNNAIVILESGDTVAAGDALRFLPRMPPSSPYRFIMIGSVDGNGQASLFYPEHETEDSVPLPPAGEVLPGAEILDAALGPEHITAIFSDRPLRGTQFKLLATGALPAGGPGPAQTARFQMILRKR